MWKEGIECGREELSAKGGGLECGRGELSAEGGGGTLSAEGRGEFSQKGGV